MSLVERIKSLAQKHEQLTIATRQHLHANPELSFEEHETSAYVQDQLKKLGIPFEGGYAGTGIVALIEGKNPDKKITALRADMDALPILEKNEVPYKSKNEGVMHACGHDVHTASLLGAARILNELKDSFEGTIKLIFQPGEEKAPGGASLMIKEGALKNPSPGSILGQHVMPLIPVGKVGFRSGMYMASADEVYLTVKGKGGHGAMPERNIDPVLIASHIIVALQQIISRNGDPKIPSVLSFGRFIAEGATNVIPGEVNIEGTFRTMNEEWRASALKKIQKMAESMAEGMGGSCEVNIIHGYPYLENHPELSTLCREAAVEYLGEENVLDLDLWMASEDFSYYCHETDACFYRLGVRNEAKGITSMVHTPTFNVDEDALKIGAGLMAWLAVRTLEKDYK